jgi:hypothetical protein
MHSETNSRSRIEMEFMQLVDQPATLVTDYSHGMQKTLPLATAVARLRCTHRRRVFGCFVDLAANRPGLRGHPRIFFHWLSHILLDQTEPPFPRKSLRKQLLSESFNKKAGEPKHTENANGCCLILLVKATSLLTDAAEPRCGPIVFSRSNGLESPGIK